MTDGKPPTTWADVGKFAVAALFFILVLVIVCFGFLRIVEVLT